MWHSDEPALSADANTAPAPREQRQPQRREEMEEQGKTDCRASPYIWTSCQGCPHMLSNEPCLSPLHPFQAG